MPVDRNICAHRHIEMDGWCSDCDTTTWERARLREEKDRRAELECGCLQGACHGGHIIDEDRLRHIRDGWVTRGNETLEMAAELLALRARVAELEAASDRVRQVHEPIEALNVRYPGGRRTEVCTGCGTDDGNWQTYPCPTIRALNDPRPAPKTREADHGA